MDATYGCCPAAQDHKRLLDGDRGPNTGGMGAYAPVSIATPAVLGRVTDAVLLPTLRRTGAPGRHRIAACSTPGSCCTPTARPTWWSSTAGWAIPRRRSCCRWFGRVCSISSIAAARGESLPDVDVRDGAAVTTILAAAGYPDAPEKGAVITIAEQTSAGRDRVSRRHAAARRWGAGGQRRPRARRHGGGADFPVRRRRAAGPRLLGSSSRAGKCAADIGWREAERTCEQ